MWLSLILVVLILAIAFLQANHGLFSALIMTVVVLCSAAIAFGTYEWVAIHWAAPYLRPSYAMAVALGLTFGVPLAVLRVSFDSLVHRACLLPAWVDRAGGGALGLVSGMVIVGVIATILQQIPFEGSVLGYGQIELPVRKVAEGAPDPKPPDQTEHRLWMTPDRFAVSVASFFSDGIFSGSESLAASNPDIIQAIGWVNAVPSEVSRYVEPGSFSVVSTSTVQFVYDMTMATRRTEATYKHREPKSDHEFRLVRVKLDPKARDANKSHLFTIRQFRLVGTKADENHLDQWYPMAIQQDGPQRRTAVDENDRHDRHIENIRDPYGVWPETDVVFKPREGNDDEVEIVFELPLGVEPFYLEYKRGARVSLEFEEAGDPTDLIDTGFEEASTASSKDSPAGGTVANKGRGGRVRGLTTIAGRSHFGDDMPMTLTAYRTLKNAEIKKGALVDGHLVGYVGEQEDGKDQAVARFHVPEDKRLLQLNTSVLKSRSTLGRALSFARDTLQNYTVEALNGQQYKVVGKYGVANVNGDQMIEIQYFSNQAGSIGGMGKFSKMREKHFRGDYTFVLLFLVDPGVEIVSFSTGGSASRGDDLSDEGLVAPD